MMNEMEKTSNDISNNSNKRKKHFMQPTQKRRLRQVLEPGLKGFLCSCNFKEKECIRESYNILNTYADKLYGTDKKEVKQSGDVEDDLAKEIESLKSFSQKSERRFQVVESGAKNFLFIRTLVEDPVKLVETVVKDAFEKKLQMARFLIRLIPIEVTCKAFLDDIKKGVEPLLEKYFNDSPKSYSIVINRRNNNLLSKDALIEEVAKMVAAKRSDHKVDLKNAEVSIIIEIIRNIALLSVVPNYFKYKKYNLHAICEDDNNVKKSTDDASTGDDLNENT